MKNFNTVKSLFNESLGQRFSTGVTRRVLRCAAGVWEKFEEKGEKLNNKRIVKIHDQYYF
jgi:hypothetical protein